MTTVITSVIYVDIEKVTFRRSTLLSGNVSREERKEKRKSLLKFICKHLQLFALGHSAECVARIVWMTEKR